MSVTQTLRAVELLRSFGVPVTFEPGWDTRGNGQSSAYQGGIIHHTGGSYSDSCPGILIFGRSDLAGPLCNFAGLANGGIHVVAAHPANHAGASGGPSNGPFPVTGLFNKLVMGLEICYPGSQPMRDAQYRAAVVFARVMQIMYGSVERARAHRETSIEGKWDPGWAPGLTINMAELRAAAANNVEEDDMTPEDKQQLSQVEAYAREVWQAAAQKDATNLSVLHRHVNFIVDSTQATLKAVLAKLDALSVRIGQLESSGVPATIDYPRLRDEVGDELDARARDGNPSTGPAS